jgi:hypothetical protein
MTTKHKGEKMEGKKEGDKMSGQICRKTEKERTGRGKDAKKRLSERFIGERRRTRDRGKETEERRQWGETMAKSKRGQTDGERGGLTEDKIEGEMEARGRRETEETSGEHEYNHEQEHEYEHEHEHKLEPEHKHEHELNNNINTN